MISWYFLVPVIYCLLSLVFERFDFCYFGAKESGSLALVIALRLTGASPVCLLCHLRPT